MDLSPLHFRALHASLEQLPALVTAGQAVALEQAHELKRQLDKSKPAFRKLLEKLPPNSKEKEELEKGELALSRLPAFCNKVLPTYCCTSRALVTTTGRLLPFGATGVKAVNQEFRLEALFLAVRSCIAHHALLAASNAMVGELPMSQWS